MQRAALIAKVKSLLDHPYAIGTLYAIGALTALAIGFASRPNLSLTADLAEVDRVDAVIANGFSYVSGPPASSDLDDDTFSIPAVDADIEERFYNVLNESPAFEWVDNVQDLLGYDDFDTEGNIKLDRMLELIGIGERAMGIDNGQ